MPRKVEAKMTQGPIIRRAALGEVGNRGIAIPGPRVPGKPGDVIKKSVPKVIKPNISTFSREQRNLLDAKENLKPEILKDPVEPLKEEEMEVDATVEEISLAFSTHCINVKDIDSGDSGNPQLVSDYVNDIYKYLRELEERNQINPRYLEGQVITGKMRSILIDWLVQVHVRFTLLQETLFLTVAIIDRYLQVDPTIARNKLQLVGVTSMFIASKYEEMYCPEIGDFAYITDKAYTKEEIRKMEVKILNMLDFYVSYPLPLHFLRRNSKAGSVDAAQHTLAKYLIELCLPEYNMCYVKSSLLAAAALCLSLRLLDGNIEWNDTLVFYSHYTLEQITPIMCKMAAIVLKSSTSKQQAVRLKYKGSKLMKISEIPQLKSKIITTLAEKAARLERMSSN